MRNNRATSYADDISDGHGVMIFCKVLCKWKGSLYKLIWIDVIIYIVLYYLISCCYRFLLSESQKGDFEKLVCYFNYVGTKIPISFLLGFFVSGVIARWWTMYLSIPWLNRMAFLISTILVGNGAEKSCQVRLVVMRYLNLSWILLMRRVSNQMASRFQVNSDGRELSLRDMFHNFNLDRKIQMTFRKIITDSEIIAFEKVAAANPTREKRYVPEYWVPIQWAARVLQKAYIHGYMSDYRTLSYLVDELDTLRGQMHSLQIYSEMMLPLVYTQVVIIAVYSYFLSQLFSAQFLDPTKKIKDYEIDIYVPFFTFFQFLFILGWLKVAMCVMNPFGDDDEDFQTSDILDYNLDVSYRVASCNSTMYPTHLENVHFDFRPLPTQDQDSFNAFMNDNEADLLESEPPDGTEGLSAIELRRRKGICGLLCCNKVRVSLDSYNPETEMRLKTTSYKYRENINSDILGTGSLTRPMTIPRIGNGELDTAQINPHLFMQEYYQTTEMPHESGSVDSL